MTQAILFDLDGVLVDSRKAITTSMNLALEANGHPQRPAAELYRFIGPALADVFAELSSLPRESAAVVECVKTYRAVYGEISLRDTVVVAGIPEALDALSRHRLAVATSKPRAFAEPILATLGLRDRFETVAGPDLNPFGETKAQTIASALATVGLPAVMVGDRSHDIVGAHANGIPCIGALWGIGSREELEAAGADALARSPEDLVVQLG